MTNQKVPLHEVYGIQSEVPRYTYVDRAKLDSRFRYLLQTQRHIVVYGVSKQGKSCLRKNILHNSESVVIQCQPSMTLEDILNEILRHLNVNLPAKTISMKEDSAKESIQANVGAKFVVEAGVKTTSDTSSTSHRIEEKNHLNGYSRDIQFISEKLRESKKRLIFEDFHYLSEDRRIDVAFLLKSFFEYKVFVIIIGIWAEQNLLVYYNGDLSGRIEEINISWSDSELKEVIEKGEIVLNIHFSDGIKTELIVSAINNVGMLQRLVEKLCFIEQITETQDIKREVNSITSLNDARDELVTEISQKFNRIKEVFERGFRANTELKVYYQIFRLLTQLPEDKLINGIPQNEVLQMVQEYDNKIRQSDLTAALVKIEKLQVERQINPLLVTYNHKLRLLILGDREFIFYRKYNKTDLPWLQDLSS